ncbi:MAG TPA: substrate-binding domain-containing protein [Christensenellaceae bacterium]|jgi:methyl-galactoside transport system substrate-binding protein|nr:substrate-binding domain-containing protein [Christensenellaceae bacterium]
MKKSLALIMALVMALSLIGTVSAEGEVYVFWYTFADVYLTSVREALNEAFEAKDIKFIDNDANATQATQSDQINTAISAGPAGLVVNQAESGAAGIAQNILDVAKAADLPIVFFNRAISTDDNEAKEIVLSYDKAAFVGTNFEQAGKMQGDLIGDYVLENYDKLDLNGDGVISYVMFKGDEANMEAISRTKYGVENANAKLVAAGKPELKFYDDANEDKYLVDQAGTWSNTASFEYMSTILAQYNAANNNMVELVIANNDDMAFGAVNALTNAGYNTGNEGDPVIPVFGVDATATAQELIANGRMVGTIKQDAVGMADAVATLIKNMIDGKDKFEDLNENYVQVEGWRVDIPYSAYTGE